MEDFPRTVTVLESHFSTVQACRAYFFRLRWPDGFRCGRCGGNSCWPTERGLFMCAACRKHTYVMAGTIFKRTRTPLPVWFQAIRWVVTQKNGANALGLQRVLGLGSYETAWTWLHKIRRAVVRPDRDRINGLVKTDETYLGGLEEGVRGRETFKKALVVIAAQEDEKAIGRIRMRRISDASTGSLLPFVESGVEPCSLIHTDGWLGCTVLEEEGYGHEVTVLNRSKASASELQLRVHRVASLLRRLILFTHQGAVSPEHLDGYLDEFTFRFNRHLTEPRQALLPTFAERYGC